MAGATLGSDDHGSFTFEMNCERFLLPAIAAHFKKNHTRVRIGAQSIGQDAAYVAGTYDYVIGFDPFGHTLSLRKPAAAHRLQASSTITYLR